MPQPCYTHPSIKDSNAAVASPTCLHTWRWTRTPAAGLPSDESSTVYKSDVDANVKLRDVKS